MILRTKLSPHSEVLYYIFFLPLLFLMSAGYGSVDKVYQIVFAVCLAAWALKVFCTDYTWEKWVIIESKDGLQRNRVELCYSKGR